MQRMQSQTHPITDSLKPSYYSAAVRAAPGIKHRAMFLATAGLIQSCHCRLTHSHGAALQSVLALPQNASCRLAPFTILDICASYGFINASKQTPARYSEPSRLRNHPQFVFNDSCEKMNSWGFLTKQTLFLLQSKIFTRPIPKYARSPHKRSLSLSPYPPCSFYLVSVPLFF